MEPTIRKCAQEDVGALRAISRKTFQETFAGYNAPSEMQAYLDRAYEIEKLRGEIQNEHMQFYFLYFNGVLAGYLKLNEAPAQTEFQDNDALEIERIYIAREFQGCGLGRFLINKAVETARARRKRYVWLGVWEKNKKAISFYQKHGFYKIGAHSFFVGSDEQTDDLMRKDL